MERIAPLAKILAEANGIDWQKLQGTGEGGMVVEQDILNYLSRIMSGEEEPPATPVDAPPPDWEGDLASSNFDMAALSRAGVDSDITSFIEQARPAAPQVPATPVAASLEEDAMEFELDEGDTESQNEPELMPEPVAAQHVVPEVAAAATIAATATTAAEAPAAKGGLGSLLSRLYQKPQAEPAAPTVAAQPAPVPQPAAAPQPSLVGPATVTPKSDVADDVVAVPAAAVAEVVPTPVVNAPDFTAPQVDAPVQPWANTDGVVPVAPEPVAAIHEQPAPAAVVSPVTESVAAAMADAAAVAPAPVVPAAVAPAVTTPATAPRDAVWFGTYLRRDASVAALSDLRGQLSDALNRDVPLSLLVARAAQHHAATLDLNGLAVQDPSTGRTRSVQAGGLRDALVALDTDFDGTPDLLVVDAGVLDLDDLHYPHALTLSVGRVQDGRAALTLNGNVDTERAARFLASVAQTLEKPVILLV